MRFILVKLLLHLQLEGKDSYQFCIQPPYAPAFIGNTVMPCEKLLIQLKSCFSIIFSTLFLYGKSCERTNNHCALPSLCYKCYDLGG